MQNINTVIHYYRFNLDNADENKAYKKLCAELKAKGLRKFASIPMDAHNWYQNTIKPLDGTAIELETQFLFENQWNTAPTATSASGLRVFDWAETIYPNKDIKEGQWLEQTNEMKTIRTIFAKCGWCGKSVLKSDIQDKHTCPKCGKGGYLKELR